MSAQRASFGRADHKGADKRGGYFKINYKGRVTRALLSANQTAAAAVSMVLNVSGRWQAVDTAGLILDPQT